eukprot:gene12460-15665_t
MPGADCVHPLHFIPASLSFHAAYKIYLYGAPKILWIGEFERPLSSGDREPRELLLAVVYGISDLAAPSTKPPAPDPRTCTPFYDGAPL